MTPLALTVKVAGVVPVPGVTESHDGIKAADWVMLATAVKFTAPPLAEICKLCEAGADPPAVAVKASDVGLADRVAEVTWNVTGMITGLLATVAPVAVSVMVPE